MRFCKLWIAMLIVALFVYPICSWAAQAKCNDVHNRGTLNVLTINLLFSEIVDRNLRLQRIADEAKARADSGQPIDVIALQEVVSGLLVGTPLSARDMQQYLADRGLKYNLRFDLVDGVPFLLKVGNATLSRCEIVATVKQNLPVVTEEPFPGLSFGVPLPREVLMTRLNVPQIGPVNVYNTHLCANCDPATERSLQASVLLQFVGVVESFFPDPERTVLAGDFNTDLNLADNQPLYNAVVSQNFTDSYRAAQNYTCASCCNPDFSSGQGIAGCTYAVAGNPYANNPPFATGPLSRIDYIFLRHSLSVPFGVEASSVIFPPVTFTPPPAVPFVSDHSAVLTEIKLQSP